LDFLITRHDDASALVKCRQESAMEPDAHRPRWKTLLAFAIIYFVWGSTFLAIRVGVRELPPLLFAAMRFFAAGIVLFIWVMTHGERLPTRRQWASIFLLAFLIFVIDYGCLFWASSGCLPALRP
jgi:drug/metabolite transporter (DMT)-like permease